jgi:hypothetical protein
MNLTMMKMARQTAATSVARPSHASILLGRQVGSGVQSGGLTTTGGLDGTGVGSGLGTTR